MVPAENQNRDPQCICTDCPTFVSARSVNAEGRFCQTGQSSSDVINEGCLCDVCPAGQAVNQNQMFFCES
jgi:hypothetical protein